MNNTLALLTLVAAACLACAPGRAATVVDTGTPNNQIIGGFALNSTDFYAGRVSFSTGGNITSISAHILGGAAGETLTFALYANSGSNLPGAELYAAQATLGADGWNGVSGLSGWSLAAGSYWVAIEVRDVDTAGNASATGAVLDKGAPSPLSRTAFNDGSGYLATNTPMSFGLRIEGTVTAVPEPAQWVLLGAGLVWIGARRFRLTR
jgi:hypothetical protein